jgi:hypothetical protein
MYEIMPLGIQEWLEVVPSVDTCIVECDQWFQRVSPHDSRYRREQMGNNVERIISK